MPIDSHRLDVHLSLIKHQRELVDVVRLAGRIGSQNDLAGRDDSLCIVTLSRPRTLARSRHAIWRLPSTSTCALPQPRSFL